MFRETEALLQDWSISRLLAFGSHLYLLEGCAVSLKEEVSPPIAQRIGAFVWNSRKFINAFEEWHEYVQQSVELDLKLSKDRQVIIDVVKRLAASLSGRSQSVDPSIPLGLEQFAETAASITMRQGSAAGIMSALRSTKNIAISFAEYATALAQTGYHHILKNRRIMSLLRIVCRFHRHAIDLSAIYPDLVWLRVHAEEFRILCDMLGRHAH